MALSDLVVFNDWSYGSMTETVAQQTELFNIASQGAITMIAGNNTGDYSEVAAWKKLAGQVVNRDAYASGTVSAVNLEHLLETSVKVGAATPPVNIPPYMMEWINRDPQEAGQVYGEQLAGDIMQKQLNDIIGSGVAALSQVAAVNQDATAGTMDIAALSTGASKFGDRASSLVTWVMHSKSLHDIYSNAISNSERLFVFGNIQVSTDGFGRTLIMTDADELHFDNAGTENYRALGLVPMALNVQQNDDFFQNTDTDNGGINIQRTIQSEWSNNYSIKGFSWDKVNGGKSPNDAELRTATNWDQYATSIKDLAGVVVTSL